MGLFGKKSAPQAGTPEKKKKKETASSGAVAPASVTRNVSAIIGKPHITEKAALLTDKNVYTFVVHKNATKYDVKEAVVKLYNVTPTKIHVVNRVPRERMSGSRGRTVKVSGIRKAYVYLKKGDRIELV